jgi:catechol 2,3-dioxygenase-like lactoylglutathione lyase family enzyme/nitrite reductase/ring-hydroxylating ferredoxin subunit
MADEAEARDAERIEEVPGGVSASYGGTTWVPDAFQLEMGYKVPEPSDMLHGRQADRSDGAGSRQEWIEALSHIVIGVRDVERSEEWYTNFLQLDLLGRDLTAEERPHTVLRTNGGELVILVEDENPVPLRPGTMGMHHSFALTPNQYRRMVQRARDFGYQLVNLRAVRMAHGEYEVTIPDPDGHSIEVTTTGPEASEILRSDVGVVDCGAASAYKVGAVKLFTDGNFFIVRLKEGFLALSQWCTHRNGLLSYQKTHWQFLCPFHQATYNCRGETTGGPAMLPLRLHPISFTSEGHILVNTDEVMSREQFDPAQAVQPPRGEIVGVGAR